MINYINEITVWLDKEEDENADTSMARILCSYSYLLSFVIYGSLASYYDYTDDLADDFRYTLAQGHGTISYDNSDISAGYSIFGNGWGQSGSGFVHDKGGAGSGYGYDLY